MVYTEPTQEDLVNRMERSRVQSGDWESLIALLRTRALEHDRPSMLLQQALTFRNYADKETLLRALDILREMNAAEDKLLPATFTDVPTDSEY